MGNFQLQSGEKIIGKWTINYLPIKGGRYLGELAVTDKRLLFKTEFDVSAIGEAVAKLGGAAAVASALGLNRTFVRYEQNLLNVAIPKSEIKDVSSQEKFLSKKVIVTLKDGSVHTFDYGMLAIKKIIEAINQK